jgi:mannose-P-dolichol utilization defect 1
VSRVLLKRGTLVLIRRTVVSARSARGVSLSSYALETICYLVSLAYSYRNGFPFSTYGENFFLGIQNVIITLLIIHYPSSTFKRRDSSSNATWKVAGAALVTVIAVAVLYSLSTEALALLQLSTLPIGLFSKLPQIAQNHRAKTTGQLSSFAVCAQILGCLARLFTTATEVDDVLVLAGFLMALILNCVLGAQIWIYYGKDGREAGTSGIPLQEKSRSSPIPITQHYEQPTEVVVTSQSPSRSGTPGPPGRRWARKVD